MPLRSDYHKPPILPPGFAARHAAEPWQTALAEAAAGQQPGTLTYDWADGLLDAALVLTPDRPVGDAAVLRLGTLAMRDALIATVLPETLVSAGDACVAVNHGEVATVSVARGPDLGGGVPAWLVLGLSVRLALGLDAPGLTPWLTDLAEEGVDVTGPALLETICRHLLSAIDLWEHEGTAGIDRAWAAALAALPA